MFHLKFISLSFSGSCENARIWDLTGVDIFLSLDADLILGLDQLMREALGLAPKKERHKKTRLDKAEVK